MIKKLIIISMLALVLAACGNSTQQGDNNDENGAINQATAVEAIEVTEEPAQSGGEDIENDLLLSDDLDLGLPSGFKAMPTVEGFLNILKSPIGEWDCSESTVSGDATDADDDGIAKNATYNIECVKDFAGLPIISELVTVKRTGTLTMKDADDNDPTSGYIANGDITFDYLDEAFTTKHLFSRNWSGNASSGYDFDNRETWKWDEGGMELEVMQVHKGSYTPDDASDPFAAGQLIDNASVKYTVDNSAAQEISAQANIHFNKSCTPAADDGEIAFRWEISADGNMISAQKKVVEFTACGEYNIK